MRARWWVAIAPRSAVVGAILAILAILATLATLAILATLATLGLARETGARR